MGAICSVLALVMEQRKQSNPAQSHWAGFIKVCVTVLPLPWVTFEATPTRTGFHAFPGLTPSHDGKGGHALRFLQQGFLSATIAADNTRRAAWHAQHLSEQELMELREVRCLQQQETLGA